MLKKYFILFAAAAVLAGTMESCFLRKNRCDSCPSKGGHQKKVRKSSKGSI